jgi:hypothetical protein
MIKKFIRLVIFLIVLSSITFYLTNCQKQQEGLNKQTNDQISIDEKSQAMTSHVLAFKAKMEYYRNNPDLKSGGELYTADSAVLELESLLNFNFCYTGIECNKKTFEISEITMPLNEIERIHDPNLMLVYYDKVIDTIQAQMGRVDYENMKLLLVDLEVTGTDSNGDAIVSIGVLVGSEGNVSTTDEVGYWFGNYGGTCEHAGAGATDATVEIYNDILFIRFAAPPPGKIRRKTNILTLLPILPEDHFIVPENQRDNFKDSKLFYAKKNYGTITNDTRCISGYFEDDSEMLFYRNNYQQFINEAEIDYELDFTDCLIDDFELFEDNQHSQIWHELQIHLGHVWLVDDSWQIDDILYY